MNILIVDDIEDNIDSLDRLITQFTRRENQDVKVFKATNGQMAIDICSKNTIDLVFMDIVMPIMGGIEATKVIKANQPSIMIVAVSSEKDESTIQEILNSGAEDYVNKPFSSSAMLIRLKNYTQLLASRNSISYQPKSINTLTNKIYSYNMKFFISNEDELAQFWETMLVRLEFQEHINHLSDFVRFIFQLGSFQIKKSYKFNIYVEEDADFFYFSINNMNILPHEYINKMIEKGCQGAVSNIDGDIISFALPRIVHRQAVEIIETSHETHDNVVIEQEELKTFKILEDDELEEFEFILGKLKTEITMMGSSDLNLDDIDIMNDNISRLTNILNSSNDAYNISSSLSDLSILLNEHSEDFLQKSKDLSQMMTSFLNDLFMWKDMIFYTGAPSVGFLDDSILSNVQMVRAVLIVDENVSDNLDDIFDF
ncbi:response regulator [Sulfurimonas sp.]|nr:response regulator [Sulfurimonas sp.]